MSYLLAYTVRRLMKYLLFLAFASASVHAATVISSVTQVGNVFRYEYTVEPQIDSRDVRQTTVPVCDAFDARGDGHFKIRNTTLRFDNDKPTGPFTFSFSSYHASADGFVDVKTNGRTYSQNALHPSSIPEPSSLFFAFGFVLLCNRRRP